MLIFPEGIKAMGNENNLVQVLNFGSPRPYPTMITVTPQAPPHTLFNRFINKECSIQVTEDVLS